MDPSDSLRAIEVALRLAIRHVIGGAWIDASGAPDISRLEEKRQVERKRRDGAAISSDLLEYVETYHLTTMIKQNWEAFKQVFDDRQRTLVYFKVVEDVRNSIAHSRDLMEFERDLVSGIAGQIRNQVSMYRALVDESSKYYPSIEKVTDGFGTPGEDAHYAIPTTRVDVGDLLTFEASAFSADGRPVIWYLQKTKQSQYVSTERHEVARGDSVNFSYRTTEEDVSENFYIGVVIATESKFHRHPGHDDLKFYRYQVSPPRFVS